MTTPAFVTAGTAGNTGSGTATSVVLAKPASIVAGNLLVAVLGIGFAVPTITPPSGWTLLGSDHSTDNALMGAVYTKVATGSEPSTYTFGFSTAVSASGFVLQYSDATGAALLGAQAIGSPAAGPSASVLLDNLVISTVSVFSESSGIGVNTTSAPAGTTLRQSQTSSSNLYPTTYAYDELAASAGTLGPFDSSFTPVGTTDWVALTVTLVGAPLAPTLTAPANNSYADLAGAGGTFAWAYNTGGASGGQTGYIFERVLSGVTTYWNATSGAFQAGIVTNTSTAQTVTIPSGKFTDGNAYSWSVATVDAGGTGPFAAAFTINAQAPPTVTVSAPTGTITTTRFPTVTWSATPAAGATITATRVITYTSAQYTAGGFVPGVGPNVDDSGVLSGSATSYVTGVLPLNTTYRSYVFAQQTPGGQSGLGFSGFTINVATAPNLPILQVQVAFTSNMLAAVGTWTDITKWVLSFDTQGGRQHELDHPEPTKATIKLNNRDGRFTPYNTGSPYSVTTLGVAGSGLTVGKPVRILATWSNVTYPIYYGFSDSWKPNPLDALNQECTLTCGDILEMLAIVPICNTNLYPDAVLSLSPVAYWRCNDAPNATQAADFSGHSNPGVEAGFFTGTSPVFFGFGGQDTPGTGAKALLSLNSTGGGSGALLYDTATCLALVAPVTSYGYLEPTSSLGLTSNGPWSISLLFQGQPGNCEGASLLYLAGGTFPFGIGILYDNGSTNGYLVAAVQVGGSWVAISPLGGGIAVNDGNWHHLVLSGAGSGAGVEVYLDSVNVSSSALNADVPNSTPTSDTFVGLQDNIMSGGALGLPGSGVTINVQDVAFFNTALTAANVLFLNGVQKYLKTLQFSGDRINTVLTIIGYINNGVFDYPHSLATGTIELQPEITSQTQVAALDYILNCADTELGFFYQGDDGVLNYRDANWITSNTDSNTSQATFADNNTTNQHYLPAGLAIVTDPLDVWNDIQVQAQQGAAAGVMQEVTDASSISYHGLRVLQRTGLLFNNDSDALAQATLLLARYKTPIPRVALVTIGAEINAGISMAQALGRQFWDQLTFGRQGPGEVAFSQASLIESKAHSFLADPGQFHTTWIMSPYELIT